MSDDTARALAQAGRQLKESAVAHKRAAGQHRRLARAQMQALTDLGRHCERLGIHLDIETTEPEEAQSGNADRAGNL